MNDVAGKKVLIVAGEASGDLHGANLVRAMLALDPGLDFYGIGGPKMEFFAEVGEDVSAREYCNIHGLWKS